LIFILSREGKSFFIAPQTFFEPKRKVLALPIKKSCTFAFAEKDNINKHVHSMKTWLKLLIASIVIKLIYLSFAVIIHDGAMSFSYDSYKSVIKQNDAWWYEKVVTKGYPATHDKHEIGSCDRPEWIQSTWAFFPMYPLLNKALMMVLHIGYDNSAFIWSILLSYFGVLGLYLMCQIYYADKRKSFYISLLFIVFPFHYYFSMMYTEALFFTLTIYSFILIHKRLYKWLPLLFIPLAITRPNGLLILLPLYLYYLEQEQILSTKHFDVGRLVSRKNIGITFLFATGVISFAGYCLYQYRLTGYFHAFSIAQAGWGKAFTMPWNAFFTAGDFVTKFDSVYVLAVMVYAVCIGRKVPLSWNILIWFSMIFPLLGGNTVSMPRFISMLFPLTMVLGSQLFSLQKFKINYIFLLLLLGLQLWCFTYWLHTHPFSY
jgi:hypothetical protein